MSLIIAPDNGNALCRKVQDVIGISASLVTPPHKQLSNESKIDKRYRLYNSIVPLLYLTYVSCDISTGLM